VAKRETVVCLEGVVQQATQASLENEDHGVFLAKGDSVHRACVAHRERGVLLDLQAKPANLDHVASEVKRTAKLVWPMKRKFSAAELEPPRNALHSGFRCVV